MVAQLADAQVQLIRHIDDYENRVNRALLALTASQKQTEEKLHALIGVVDGMQRGGQK